MSLRHDSIDLDAFNETLARYPDLILEVSDSKQKRRSTGTDADETLASLDTWRLKDLPETLAARRQSKREDDYLQKAEVEKLIRWKLKHGTFRPSLMKLVSSNSEDVIRDTTTRAYAAVSSISAKAETITDGTMEALSILTSLRGIGPASASLLLSVRFPQPVPFFSDEAYRWLTCATSGDPWTSSIKYNAKEFRQMLEAFIALFKRLGVDAVDAERVGWVLGHEKATLDQTSHKTTGSKRKQEDVREEKAAPEAVSDVIEPRSSKGTKR